MKLFCLPFAGGSRRAYLNWSKFANRSLEIEAIEIKGRGERLGEGFYPDMTEAVDDIYSWIKDKIQVEDYAFYGHSMGTLLAYELYYKVIAEGQRKPAHIFFSGRQSPIVKNNMYVSSTMPDDEFIAKIIELGGIHEELSQSKELMRFYLPVLKNDIRIMENYEFKEKTEKIKCEISVFHGLEDTIDGRQAITWNDLCDKKTKFYYFTGNHFFINDHVDKIIDIFEGELLPEK
ncbi:thioesterase II family protein [Paenibacillus alvei]|uniref:thioesterase II family protein n=1 Tax=Paenibacillus alvei TaxID=44250 RepID=UPI0018CD19E4|nr:thioesterase [Paenibacillus alvei]MBG9736905.1 gramicidin dehydrogenase [Paenibacillus alvei]MBG9746427.1 gramicidin dehydrogenase [Paenibacillus alvei]MCY9579248.1 thioesterase domain-containing protein [Paenibacillus alvei]MCY9583704.1 thioesterase domain-containing protein [Paenibacillus alvei]